MNELYMYALYRPYSIFSLEDAKFNAGVKIELPYIERHGSIIKISFDVAKAEKILRYSIIIDGVKIKNIDAVEIGEFKGWYGVD